MFSDYEEFESPAEVLVQREKELGFKAQAENIYNSLLPYSQSLDCESSKWLANLKSHLGEIVGSRDVYYGFAKWMQSLNKYIKLYGLKFSKSDHITFIKVFYEFVTTCRVDYAILANAVNLLSSLLYRRYLIESSELTLNWRPLYDLFNYHFCSSSAKHDMFQVPPPLRNGIRVLIRYAQPYFPPGATVEILQTLKPLMCPLDVTSEKAIDMFQMFLPTFNVRDRKESTYQLWFDDFLAYLKIFNSPHVQGYIFMLYSRLAEDNIGSIDWNPILPLLFFQNSKDFCPTCGYKNVHVGIQSYPYSANQMQISSRWIVATMGGKESQTQAYLNKMFKSLESYFHPTNVGPYSTKLMEFLARLCLNFVRRLRQERSSQKYWGNTIPEGSKLTEDDVTKFVESLKPIILLSLYSRAGIHEKGQVLPILATLRPQLIIPDLVERMNTSLEALTEPHKLTASIAAIASVARPLVSSGAKYSEGPTCVIPLLISSLPGLDPNDFHKSITTLQLISNFCMLIPIVDCSDRPSSNDLSTEESILRNQTASFEEFVIQFLDRCFAFIDNSSFEYTREFVNTSVDHQSFQEEGLIYTWVGTAFQSIMFQASSDIFEIALKKLEKYIKGKILEHKVAGKLAAGLCYAVTRANPKKGLPVFLTDAIKNIKSIISSHDGILQQENTNTEIMFNLRIIFEVIYLNGYELLSYVNELEEILDLTLHMKNVDAHSFACMVLKRLLSSLSLVYPLEYRLIPHEYDDTNKLYLNEWGISGDIHDLKLHVHDPTDEEMECVQRLVNKFIGKELCALEEFASGARPMPRTEVKNRLNIIKEAIVGAAYVLPTWTHEEHIKLVPSLTIPAVIQDNIIVHSRKLEVNLNGENVRWKVIQVLDKLQSRLIMDEDDTKSLNLIIRIYYYVQDDFGIRKDQYNAQYSAISSETTRLENKLLGKKANIRSILIEQVMLQHFCRISESMHLRFTETHLKVMNNLLKLSTSKYHNVRIIAQDVLIKTMNQVLYSYTKLIPSLVQILKDSKVTDEQLKGALFLIKGSTNRSLISKHNWEVQEKLWQAIIDSPVSSKNSIISLMENGLVPVVRNCVSFMITSEIPDSFIQFTNSQFKENGTFHSGLECISDSDVKSYIESLNKKNDQNAIHYNNLVNSLTDTIELGNIHWRRYNFAYTMIIRLIRCDIELPVRTISIFVKNLLSENLQIRSASNYAVTRVLRQLKRKHPKINVSVPDLPLDTIAGDRTDNEWLCYDPSNLPDSEEQWDRPKYVHKTHYGYNIWPKDMTVYAPYAQQPKLDRSRDELTEREKIFFDFFMDQGNIDKFIHFNTIEYNKDHDKFNCEKFAFFKGIFRNFGDSFLHLFRPHLERLVNDNRDSYQRCACEIIAGIIRGAKHWNYTKTKNMYSWLIPLIRIGLEKVSPDSTFDWGTCFATSSESRDPNKIYWVLKVLMEEPIRSQGSFIDSSRLYVLQGFLSQQEWRVGHLLHELNNFLKPFLTHPFKNVRDRLGSVLMSIYLIDVSDTVISYHRGPLLKDFFREVLPQLQIVIEESETNNTSNVTLASDSIESSELQKGMRLLQTVSKFVTCIITRGLSEIRIDYFNLLPMLCVHQANSFELSLAQDCTDSLAALSQSILPSNIVPEWIQAMEKTSTLSSWKARLALLEFLQVSVFCNFPLLTSREEWTIKICNMIVLCLKDKSIEVREKGSFVLSGLIHSDFITENKSKELLKSFFKRAKSRTNEDDSIIKRHSGVLGLCAFVSAYPYDVPECVPDILVVLSDHLHDSQPIPDVIRRTMQDFKRTHQSNWEECKLKFTEDQFSVFSDISVSPSYYA
ncbi:LOW QUALITY PROTEIN: proteasome activator complex subunit 4 [Lepeophtheirus salmonis]|uniref:LOW QUALITY PROTEIN: proteasome activator complex subunit 4 n=1 Tax=Lepeophtheirus salmonis TaxID=72036 RepID=UPI003AF3326A